MDVSQFAGVIKRILLSLAIGLLFLLSLHSLGIGWSTSLVLALLPVVLGSFNIFAGRIFMVSGLLMIIACLNAFISSEGDRIAHTEIGTAVLQKTSVAIDSLVPQVSALASATVGALDQVAARATAVPASGVTLEKAGAGTVSGDDSAATHESRADVASKTSPSAVRGPKSAGS
jgi:hypothetical protein